MCEPLPRNLPAGPPQAPAPSARAATGPRYRLHAAPHRSVPPRLRPPRRNSGIRPANVRSQRDHPLTRSDLLAGGLLTASVGRRLSPMGGFSESSPWSWDSPSGRFYVVRAEIAFGVGDQEAVARPGTFVHVPAGTTHWFRFGAGGVEMVSLTSRAPPRRSS